jgi:hypothetical protein
LRYVNNSQKYNSIFDASKNEIVRSMENEKKILGCTYGIVYEKTPYILYSFSKKTGREKILNILSEFYKQIMDKEHTNFQEFEDCFKSHGVTDEQWIWFVKNL